MIDKSVLLKLYSRLHSYLHALSNFDFFYRSEDHREQIANCVTEVLPLFSWLSISSSKQKEHDDLFSKLKKAYHLKEDAKQIDFSDKTESEISDEVNYLKICIKNICSVDLDEDDFSKLEKKNDAFKRYDRASDSLAMYRNFFAEKNDLLDDLQEKNDLLDDLLIRSHAWDRLNQDIRDGSVYIYKTKPKRNVFIKYFLLVGYLLGLFLSLSLVFIISSNGSKDESMTFALASTSSCYFVYSAVKIKTSFNNENYKYSFQKQIFYFAFFILAAAFLASYYWISNGNSDQPKTSLTASLTLIACINCFVYFIAYLFLQPEKDKKLMNDLLAKHMADISNSGSGFSFE